MSLKKSEKFKLALSEILLSSTSYGLPNVIRSKRNFVKLMWSLAFVFSTTYGFYSFYSVLNDYFEYNTVSSFNIVYELPTEFPTISLCNFDPSLLDYSLNDIMLKCEFNNNKSECVLNDFEIFTDSNDNTCYRFNSQLNATKYSTRPGRYYGFYIELITVFPKMKYEYKEAGYKVVIHNRSVIPSLTNEGIFVAPGSSTRLIINRIFNERLTLPYNDCIKDLKTYKVFNRTFYDKVTFNSTKTYRQRNCFDMCYHSAVLKQCDCATNIFKEEYYESCSNATDKCKHQVSDTFFVQAKINDFCNSYCPQECDSISYQITTSFSDFPSEVYANTKMLLNKKIKNIFQNETLNYEKLKRSVLGLYVYYDDLKYTLISQQAKVKLDDLISNLGGTLGLFIGISFLSLFEVIEILIEASCIFLFEK